MNQLPAEMRDQLNFQASLLRMMANLETSVIAGECDEKVAVEVEKLASRL